MFSDVTKGELAMVAFIFALIYGAGFLVRLGRRLGSRLGDDEGTGDAQ